MGATISYFYPEEDDYAVDVPDPVTGLTPRQKRVLRNTWSPITRNLKVNGVEFFIKLFKKHSDYQKMFKGLVGKSETELRASKRLQAHASGVMYSITNLVENLDDNECLIELLKKIGENHGRRGLRVQDFENLTVVFLDFMELTLPSTLFTENARQVWESTFRVMNTVFNTAIQEVIAEEAEEKKS